MIVWVCVWTCLPYIAIWWRRVQFWFIVLLFSLLEQSLSLSLSLPLLLPAVIIVVIIVLTFVSIASAAAFDLHVEVFTNGEWVFICRIIKCNGIIMIYVFTNTHILCCTQTYLVIICMNESYSIIWVVRLSKVLAKREWWLMGAREGIMITFTSYYSVDLFCRACGHLMRKRNKEYCVPHNQPGKNRSQNKVIIRYGSIPFWNRSTTIAI